MRIHDNELLVDKFKETTEEKTIQVNPQCCFLKCLNISVIWKHNWIMNSHSHLSSLLRNQNNKLPLSNGKFVTSLLYYNKDYIRQKDQVYIWRLLTCSQSLGLFFHLTLSLGWILIWSNYKDKATSLFKMNGYVFYQISKLQLSDTNVHSFFSPLILVFISK